MKDQYPLAQHILSTTSPVNCLGCMSQGCMKHTGLVVVDYWMYVLVFSSAANNGALSTDQFGLF